MDHIRKAPSLAQLQRPLTRRKLFMVTGAMAAAAAMSACGGSDSSSVTATSSGGPAGAASPRAAGSPAASGGTKRIPLFTTENDPATLAFYDRTIAAYRQQRPDVSVEVSLYQDENQLQYLTTAFETGTDLGIFAPTPGFVTTWAKQGYLLPLDQIIQNVGAADFLDGTRIVVDGKDYAMPFQSNASALWVRQDLFQAEGLNPPTTYDEYVAAAKALNGKNGVIGVASVTGGAPQATLQFFTPYILQSGWDYFDKQGNLTFDRPEVLDAVKRFAGIMKYASPSLYNGTFQDIQNAYISGRAAMATFPGRLGVNVAAQAPDIAEKSTVVPVPAGPFMTGKLLFGGILHYSIHSKTAYPDEALAFLEFMTTAERELDFAMTVPGHLLPPLESVRKLVPTYKSDYMTAHGAWVTALNDMVPGAMNPALSMGSVSNQTFDKKLSNPCPWASQVWTNPPIDGTMFQEILINGKDPEAAWTTATAALKKVSDDWKQANPDWTPSV